MSDTALSVGNNMEFSVATAGTEVTIYFNQVGNDTDTVKYPHTSDLNQTASCRKFTLRTNQTISITGLNRIIFKDPVTVIINTAWTERFSEKFSAPIYTLKIRTSVDNTTVRIRWHGSN